MRAVSTQDAVVVGCYGFFLPDKGIPELIQALSILRQTWPQARLRLVNARYPLFLSTDEIARCKGLVAAAGSAPSPRRRSAANARRVGPRCSPISASGLLWP